MSIQAGQEFSFGVTFDSPSLDVAAEIYDDSGASPVLLAVVPMLNYAGNTYRGKYTENTARSLLIQKSVFTDDTYLTRDQDYSQADETQQVVSGGGSSSSSSCIEVLIGVVSDQGIMAIVKDSDIVI